MPGRGITHDATAWTGQLLLNAWDASDPELVQCYTLPRARDRARRDPAVVWTGRELPIWSGGGGEEIPPDPDGIGYRPPSRATR